MRQKSSGLVLWLFAVAAFFALTLKTFYPGLLTPDSLEQLLRARSGVYNDWQPPLMSFVWSCFLRFQDGPAGMLVFHNLCFWAAVFLFGSCLGSWRLRILLLLMTQTPGIASQLGVVWKDTGLSASAFLSFASALAFHELKLRPRSPAGALACGVSLASLYYASAVRPMTALSMLPLACFTAWAFGPEKKRLLPPGALFLAGVIFSTGFLFNRQLAGERRTYPSQQVKIFDLAGMSLGAGRELLPGFARANGGLEEIRKRYSPETALSVTLALASAHTAAEVRELDRAWLSAVRSYPGAYLRHRAAVFLSFLRWGRQKSFYALEWGLSGRPGLEFEGRRRELFRSYQYRMLLFADSLFFKPWLYMAAGIGLLAVAAVRWRRGETDAYALMALAASGVFYILPSFFILPGSDFRYAYWPVLSALSGLLLAARRTGFR